ncbi:MAG: zinc ribbon domain-containing protein [Clostridia bacterium]|nr:zinc ribbon domain-containing protein [Clostridia bacterium]
MEQHQFCTNCGTRCSTADTFCPTCGARLAAPTNRPTSPGTTGTGTVNFGGILSMFKLSQWITIGISLLMFILLLATNYISVGASSYGLAFFTGLSRLSGLPGGTTFLLVLVWIFTLVAILGFALTVLKLILRDKLRLGQFNYNFFFIIACGAVVLMFLFSVIGVISLNSALSRASDGLTSYLGITYNLTFALFLELILAIGGIALRVPQIQALLKRYER